MEFVITFLLTILIVFFLAVLGDREDFFSPKNIIPIVFFIKTIPTMFYISTIGIPSTITNELIINAINSPENFFKYSLIEFSSFLLTMLVVNHVIDKKKISNYNRTEIMETNVKKRKRIRFLAFIVLLVGLVGFSLNIYTLGGLNFFLNNLQYRTILLRNQDVYTWIQSVIIYSPLLMVYSKKYSDNKNLNIMLLTFIFFVGLIDGMGGRKSLLFLFINALIVYNYSVKKISVKQLAQPKYILLVFFMMFIFILMPMLRLEGSFDYYINNISELLLEIREKFFTQFLQFSYVPFFLLVVKHFNPSNFWFGKNFLGMFTALIPSSLYANKPPVDDGMYLYSIALGRNDIEPVMAMGDLNLSSYPLETFGSMYANFGYIGVLLGTALVGYTISKFYLLMIKKNYSIFYILLYSTLILNFQLSTLRIIQVIISIVVLRAITLILEKLM